MKTPGRPMLELMKRADGMLDTVDRLFASMNELDWGEMSSHTEKLLEDAEAIDVTRGRKVPARLWEEFRTDQGELILALLDLTTSISVKAGPETKRRYAAVRATCDQCHETFRPKVSAH